MNYTINTGKKASLLTPAVLLCVLFLLPVFVTAQSYFKILETPVKAYHNKIGRFRNGDLLIGGSPQDGANPGGWRGFFLTRLDACGQVVWSKQYDWEQNYMELKDFVISASDEIYVYGSAYQMFQELIFLGKINEFGKVMKFSLVQGGTVDHFTYSIDLREDRLLVYGLLHDWNTQKHGFVALFDVNLNFLWGKEYTPFESVGDAIIASDGGFVCRSGQYLVKLDPAGNLVWSRVFDTGSGLYPVAGPVETPGGYVLAFYQNKEAFYFKTDLQGNILWQSPKFSAAHGSISLLPRADGSLWGFYHAEDGTDIALCRHILTAGGGLENPEKLVTSQPLQTADLEPLEGKNEAFYLLGNNDPAAGTSGILLRADAHDPLPSCFSWQPFGQSTDNDILLTEAPQEVTFYDLPLSKEEKSLTTGNLTDGLRDVCDLPPVGITRVDTFLHCGDAWQITLPAAGFHWDDGTPLHTRVVDKPGVYKASDRHCNGAQRYEFVMEKEPCPCNVYIPNAFSPESASDNAWFQCSASCAFGDYRLEVYSRWGERVFASDTPEGRWDGNCKGRPAPPGIYVSILRCTLVDEAGRSQPRTEIHDLTLIR